MTQSPYRVIGLISGTSVDGIDAALVEIDRTDSNLKVELIAGATYPYPAPLREQILKVCAGAALSMAELAELDDAIALTFAQTAQKIQTGHPPAQLIGSHGQTVYHRPAAGKRAKAPGKNPELGYSLQLGRGALIAHLTGIPTVSNFRVADIAVGGHGAPLVPKVDAYLLSHPYKSRCVQNIGGIGNLTYLPPHQGENWEDRVCGWDTGPGNTLLDLAVQQLSSGTQTYDQNGAWAATGTPCQALVDQWLTHPFFAQTPPKSTGRELFGWDYLQQCLVDAEAYHLNPANLLATLTELTAASIVHSYHTFLPQMPDQVLLCGGGCRNLYLKHRLQVHLDPSQPEGQVNNNPQSPIPVLTTDEVGLSADSKEAIAFAVLAYWRFVQKIPGNLPYVTGAKAAVTLGEVFQPI